MSATLAGTLFVYNGKSQDYCFMEAIASLREFCDYVVVCDAGSDDGTLEEIISVYGEHGQTSIIACDKSEWDAKRGKEKLNFFTNKAIEMAEMMGFDYQFNLQADEIVHEKSYDAIWDAIATGDEAFQSRRVNLWGSPYTQLRVVPPKQLPCSEVILRLAKTKYRSQGDAESLAAHTARTDFIEKIRMYHMGFVRDKKIHVEKIRHVQKDVFLVEPDKKLEGMEVFDPWRWFERTDVVPITESLPQIIQKWAADRM